MDSRRAVNSDVVRLFKIMLTVILLIGLVQFPTQGVSACDAAKSNHDRTAPLTLEQICRLETRMSLLRDGVSWNAAMKTLGIRRKNLPVIAHGAVAYRGLGAGYTLATPFISKKVPNHILLLDGQGRVVKDIQWR